jgi:hypothetical protein
VEYGEGGRKKKSGPYNLVENHTKVSRTLCREIVKGCVGTDLPGHELTNLGENHMTVNMEYRGGKGLEKSRPHQLDGELAKDSRILREKW